MEVIKSKNYLISIMNKSDRKPIGEASVSSLMPYLLIISKQNNLKLNSVRGFKRAKQILINSTYKN